MILDNEGQRNILMELAKNATIKGEYAEIIAVLKHSIANADVQSQEVLPGDGEKQENKK